MNYVIADIKNTNKKYGLTVWLRTNIPGVVEIKVSTNADRTYSEVPKTFITGAFREAIPDNQENRDKILEMFPDATFTPVTF